MDIIVRCTGVTDEETFWQAFLDAAQPDGAANFGRNFDAFRDAILGGGPGWPGEHVLQFVDFESLRAIDGGRLCVALEDLAAESHYVTIRFQ
jgi:hypothetical protein